MFIETTLGKYINADTIEYIYPDVITDADDVYFVHIWVKLKGNEDEILLASADIEKKRVKNVDLKVIDVANYCCREFLRYIHTNKKQELFCNTDLFVRGVAYDSIGKSEREMFK